LELRFFGQLNCVLLINTICQTSTAGSAIEVYKRKGIAKCMGAVATAKFKVVDETFNCGSGSCSHVDLPGLAITHHNCHLTEVDVYSVIMTTVIYVFYLSASLFMAK